MGSTAQHSPASDHAAGTPVVDSRAPLRSLCRLRSGDGGTDFMMGVKYSHRLPNTRTFAGAGFAEVAFASQTEFLLGALFQYMPVNRLLLETGPGLALDGGSDFLWRVSGEYELKIRRLSVIPKLYLDFVHGTTVVGYGVAIGRR
jgi:hypothetical protein